MRNNIMMYDYKNNSELFSNEFKKLFSVKKLYVVSYKYYMSYLDRQQMCGKIFVVGMFHECDESHFFSYNCPFSIVMSEIV